MSGLIGQVVEVGHWNHLLDEGNQEPEWVLESLALVCAFLVNRPFELLVRSLTTKELQIVDLLHVYLRQEQEE